MRNETGMHANSARFVKNANLSHVASWINYWMCGSGATHCSYPQDLNKNSTKGPDLWSWQNCHGEFHKLHAHTLREDAKVNLHGYLKTQKVWKKLVFLLILFYNVLISKQSSCSDILVPYFPWTVPVESRMPHSLMGLHVLLIKTKAQIQYTLNSVRFLKF